MRFNILIILCITFSLNLSAQRGYQIEIEAKEYKGQKVYFESYSTGRPITLDSVTLSKKGSGIMRKYVNLPNGQYTLKLGGINDITLLLSGQNKNLKITIPKNLSKGINIKGSEDSRLWNEYVLLLEAAKEENRQAITETALDNNQGTWFATYLKAKIEPQVPHPSATTEEELAENKAFLKEHYFDNTDLTDPHLLATDFFKDKVNFYLDSVVEQYADTIAAAASRLVAATQSNETCYKNMLISLIDKSRYSNAIGMENVWAKLFEDYIQESAPKWMDIELVAALTNEYRNIKNNRIGMIGADLVLERLDGSTMNLYDVKADFIVLYFYDPTCGHCQEESPILHDELLAKYKPKGLEIVAINTNPDPQEWKDFIELHKLYNWVNCSDHSFKSKYWLHYDVSGLPTVYLLDKNKKIVAKNLDAELLMTILKALD